MNLIKINENAKFQSQQFTVEGNNSRLPFVIIKKEIYLGSWTFP
jgi:hypothetical protein